MIVYQANKTQFISDVFSNDIENIVLNNVRRKLNRGAGAAEIKSWANSLGFMERIMRVDQETAEYFKEQLAVKY